MEEGRGTGLLAFGDWGGRNLHRWRAGKERPVVACYRRLLVTLREALLLTAAWFRYSKYSASNHTANGRSGSTMIVHLLYSHFQWHHGPP